MPNYKTRIAHWVYIMFLCTSFVISQPSTYVDNLGVFRWSKNDQEIRLFGVNYTLPFAHGYRAINYIGKDHKEAIDKDIYHIARLGLDAFRVHVWDAEISDEDGNIIQTEQLDLLDYTLFKMKERGIKTIVTPFKVGGNGYPEKDFPSPGFSADLSKPETYLDEVILRKQERYFTQFLDHINPYTGVAYKNDSDIIALEINNEPQHDNGEVATAYINRMVKVIRNTGFKNPIFYNVSERSQFVDNYLKANIQGCTFQWYPTGLVYNKELKGNFLPNVDKYVIPFEDKINFNNKTRIVYEFDPADNATSYIYPAMARSFREAKFQFATQFAYEPLDLSYANTEYQTHYLNLAYTPRKAIALMIASQIFHDLDNGQSFGRYPNNLKFGNTLLDPKKDLAFYNSDTKYIYTNSNSMRPKSIKTLKRIAGVGSSPLVNYSGTGAYFLDKLDNGIWRLEVLPDALWVDDPFEKASLKKTVAITKRNEQHMKLNLPDLGMNYKVMPINKDNEYEAETKTGEFNIKPGVYLVQNAESKFQINENLILGNIRINEYVAPKENIDKVYVIHKPLNAIEIQEDLLIKANIVAPTEIESVQVIFPAGYHKVDKYPMKKSKTFEYNVTIPRANIKKESFDYFIVVKTEDGVTSFPANVPGSPEDWDFVSDEMFSTAIVNKDPKVVLFDALSKSNNLLWGSQWNAVKYKVSKTASKLESEKNMNIIIEDLNAKIPDMTFKIWVEDQVNHWKNVVKNTSQIVFNGSSGNTNQQKIQIALQLRNGDVFGKVLELNSEINTYTIPYDQLIKVPRVLLPRPFPVFQPYWFTSSSNENFDPTEIESVQISVGPDISKEQYQDLQNVIISNIYLD